MKSIDFESFDFIDPLMPSGNKKATHTQTNLHLKAAGLFKYVQPLLL